jgi:hypothetical protein
MRVDFSRYGGMQKASSWILPCIVMGWPFKPASMEIDDMRSVYNQRGNV